MSNTPTVEIVETTPLPPPPPPRRFALTLKNLSREDLQTLADLSDVIGGRGPRRTIFDQIGAHCDALGIKGRSVPHDDFSKVIGRGVDIADYGKAYVEGDREGREPSGVYVE